MVYVAAHSRGLFNLVKPFSDCFFCWYTFLGCRLQYGRIRLFTLYFIILFFFDVANSTIWCERILEVSQCVKVRALRMVRYTHVSESFVALGSQSAGRWYGWNRRDMIMWFAHPRAYGAFSSRGQITSWWLRRTRLGCLSLPRKQQHRHRRETERNASNGIFPIHVIHVRS